MYRELNILLKKAKEGDMDSKEEILKRLQGLVINSIRRYYDKRNEYEDLIQIGNLVILECIDNYDDSRGVYFLGYVKTMLKYTYLNRHKERRCFSLNISIGEDEECELIDMIQSDREGPMEVVLKSEIKSELRQALYNLTDRQRDIVIFYYLNGLSIKDISTKLGIAYRTVVNTKTRALEKLKESL